METFNVFFHGIAIFQLLSSSLMINIKCPKHISTKTWALVAFLLSVWLSKPFFLLQSKELFFISFFVTGFIPYASYLFTSSLFEKEFVFSKNHFFILTSSVVVNTILMIGIFLKNNSFAWGNYYIIFKLYYVFLLFLAGRKILENWNDDLAEKRIFLRQLFLSFSVLSGSLLILFHSKNFNSLDHAASFINALIYFSLATIINIILSITDYKDISELLFYKTSINPEVANKHRKMLKNIDKIIKNEKIFKQKNLTISAFSKHLNIPEYQLRFCIHKGLGYDNFNEFINYYRIDEAKKLLDNKSYFNSKLLVLASEVGFSSLTPFHKSFKKEIGMSPSEYKKRIKKI